MQKMLLIGAMASISIFLAAVVLSLYLKPEVAGRVDNILVRVVTMAAVVALMLIVMACWVKLSH